MKITESFVHASLSTILEEIIEKETPHVKQEINLYEGCLSWSVTKMDKEYLLSFVASSRKQKETSDLFFFLDGICTGNSVSVPISYSNKHYLSYLAVFCMSYTRWKKEMFPFLTEEDEQAVESYVDSFLFRTDFQKEIEAVLSQCA